MKAWMIHSSRFWNLLCFPRASVKVGHHGLWSIEPLLATSGFDRLSVNPRGHMYISFTTLYRFHVCLLLLYPNLIYIPWLEWSGHISAQDGWLIHRLLHFYRFINVRLISWCWPFHRYMKWFRYIALLAYPAISKISLSCLFVMLLADW